MNINTNAQATSLDHDAAFRAAVIGLRDAKTKFEANELKSVPYSDLRQQHLSAAVTALASGHGVTLRAPLYIDGNGEYSIVAVEEGRDPRMGTGQFGEFAEVLNPHRPRTGIVPCALSPESGWCRINHFSVENMVMAQAAARGI